MFAHYQPNITEKLLAAVQRLPPTRQAELLQAIERAELVSEAYAIDTVGEQASKSGDSLSDEQILAICSAVRADRYAKGQQMEA